MGAFCYLINRDRRIYTEAYQYSASGNMVLNITEPEKLPLFLEYCRINSLSIECKYESFFENEDEEYNFGTDKYDNPWIEFHPDIHKAEYDE